MLTVLPRVHPKPITPKKSVGAIQGSSTWADQPNPQRPMTVEKATGMTMNKRNSGSKIPPLRRVMKRHIMSETFPAMLEPRIPPMKGAMYNNPLVKEFMLYGLPSDTLGKDSEV